MTSWQPIDTIPMDGTPVLVWAPEEITMKSQVQIARYHPNVKVVGNVFLFDLTGNRRPTHWMPFPAPPSQPGECP